MPSKKINIVCPDCQTKYSRYSQSIKNAIRNSGIWRCKACTLKKRNHSYIRPLMSKRRKKECILIKTSDGWMFEHRYIMEQHIKRKLKKNEIVHHINKIRDDNRIENLQIMDHGEHTTLHCTGRKVSAETKRKIKETKGKNYSYEKHPSCKHITLENLITLSNRYRTVREVCLKLNITKRTFYNKLKHFNITRRELCQV